MIQPSATCRRCGAALNPSETQGLCPVCLLETSLGVDEAPDGAEPVDAGWLERNQLADAPPPPGQQPHHLGDYELLEEIGRGGMGIIYRARQLSLDRFVAVKTILTGPLASPDFVQRFQTEAHAAAVLDHPNIVPIYEVGNHQGQPFYSMRLISGRNLAQELKETGAMSSRRAAELLVTVARAVHYAHQRGVLHRDLKPANILLDADGTPHVTDFGLAKLLEQDDGLTLTQAALGTPNYMAPEQAAGDMSKLTTAADVYSLGAILFETLTGSKLFTANTPLATINQAREQEPPRPSTILRTIPRDLDTICWKCLEKEPQRRYPGAQALAEDLERWLKGEPIRARRVGMAERVGLWCRRKPAMASMAGAALAAVLIVSGIATWRLMVAREQKQLEQYAAAISLADSYIRDGATDRAMTLLLQCPEHLRHWEWGRLVYLCHQEIATIHAHTNRPKWVGLPLIENLTINRDGTRLASKGLDGVFKLWDPRIPEPIFLIRSNSESQVVTWDFAPTGRHLVLGMSDGEVEVIETEKGKTLWSVILKPSTQVPGDPSSRAPQRIAGIESDPGVHEPVFQSRSNSPGSVLAVAYSPDSRRVVVGEVNGKIRVLDAAGGAILAEWKHHLDEKLELWFTPDGSRLIARSRLGVEHLEAASGRVCVSHFWDDQVYAALFLDRTGQTAVTRDRFASRQLWKCGETGFKPQESNLADKGNRHIGFFDPEGRWFCSRGEASLAAVYETATGRRLCSLARDVYDGSFSPNGDRLVTFGPDRLVRVWDMPSGRELQVLPGHLSVADKCVFSADGQKVATVGRDGIIKLWPGRPGRELAQFRSIPRIGPYSPDGRLWTAVVASKGVFVGDADTGRLVCGFRLPKPTLTGFAFGPEGRFLISVGGENVARIWDVREQRLTEVLRGHDREILTVAWSVNGRWIATGDSGGVVRIWEGASRREWKTIHTQAGRLSCVQFDPAGRRLLTTGRGLPELWEVETGNRTRQLDDQQEGGSPWATFTPDGSKIISPGVDRKIRLWDAATGALVESWTSRSQGYAVCGFSPDGRRLAVSTSDTPWNRFITPFVEIWDATSGRHLLDLRGHTGLLYGSVFNPQGDRILTTSMDGTVRQWETFPWRERDYATFPGKTSAERIRAYADHYWHQRLALERPGMVPETPFVDGELRPAPREWEAIIRPVRAPGTWANLLNLDDHYTGPLDSVFQPDGPGGGGDDSLSGLPTGIVRFHGIDFDVRGTVLLRLRDQGPGLYQEIWLNYPTRVDGIQVGKKTRQLHVLHAAVGQVPASTQVGTYVLHYADGSQQELEIVYGRDLRDWWLGGSRDSEREASHAQVAWTGTNPIAKQYEAQVRLFLRTYKNPRPDVEVVSVDFVSKQTAAAPFLVAITVEP